MEIVCMIPPTVRAIYWYVSSLLRYESIDQYGQLLESRRPRKITFCIYTLYKKSSNDTVVPKSTKNNLNSL